MWGAARTIGRQAPVLAAASGCAWTALTPPVHCKSSARTADTLEVASWPTPAGRKAATAAPAAPPTPAPVAPKPAAAPAPVAAKKPASKPGQLNEEQIAEFKKAFSYFENNGKIQTSVISTVMRGLETHPINPTDDEIEELLAEVGAETINFEDLVALMGRKFMDKIDAAGNTFPADKCPAKLPDLSKHNNLAANALRARPDIYEKYKNVTTPGGVSLAKCIKTGIDNPGHPHILTCGLVAGDEDSYKTFADLFDIVVGKRNGDYPADGVHNTDMDVNKLSKTKIDPDGKYVLTTRCRTGRSVRGLPLPPSCSFEERRETERVIVKGLMKLTGELKGEYFPLNGSRSMLGAMDHDKEEQLRKNGNLFQEPDSTLLLASGCGRHWPDARGIFHNDDENFFVWVNEEDQMRIVSMEKGDNIRAIFNRFANATKAVQESLEGDGYGIQHNNHLGYILTCPSNLGTGLRAGAMVKVPLFSARKDFKDILKKMRLQARGTAGVDSASKGGIWDISNSDRLGMSEVQLCNLFIEGIAQVIRWEKQLEKGENIDAEVAKAKPLGI